MKSEHRHELETNELSAGLAKSIEKLKPITGQLLTGVGLLLAVYAGLSIWDAQNAKTEQAAWQDFALATDTRDPEMKSLQRVAGDEKYAGTKMSEWAYVGWADRQVMNAMQYYLIDREKTQDLLRNVEGIYQGFSQSAVNPQVLNRARFGLARVYELQNKLDEARQQYLTVQGDLEPQASERAKQLENEDVREACAWLATADLPKRDLTGGRGASGVRPEFDATIPTTQPSKDGISAKSLEELLSELESETSAEQESPTKPADDSSSTEDDSNSDSVDLDSAETDASGNDAAAE